jgi:hypothetical protein
MVMEIPGEVDIAFCGFICVILPALAEPMRRAIAATSSECAAFPICMSVGKGTSRS